MSLEGNKKKLVPTNNKALYHKLGGMFDKLWDVVMEKDVLEESDVTFIDAALKASGQMITIKASADSTAKLEMILDEYNTTHKTNIKIRQVESKPYDREDGD